MDMKPTTGRSHVCLICLKRFGTSVTPSSSYTSDIPIKLGYIPSIKIEPGDDDHEKTDYNLTLLQVPISSPFPSRRVPNDRELEITGNNSPSSSTRSIPDVYSRFLRFSNRYLKLTLSANSLVHCAEQKKNDQEFLHAFCTSCMENVALVCDLHTEIEARQLQLLHKLHTLGDLMKRSTKSVSQKMERSLVKCLAQQLNLRVANQLFHFRKALQLKCTNRGKRSPKVLVHRGLFSDQWRFTFAATKQALMRLIVVFGLGNLYKQKSNEGDADVFTEEIIPGNLTETRRPRRLKKKTPSSVTTDNADSKTVETKAVVKQEIEPEDETISNFSPFDGFDDGLPDPVGGYSDPNWSSNEGPASPASNASSEVRSEDSDPDFEEKSHRKTRNGGRGRKRASNSANYNSEPSIKRRKQVSSHKLSKPVKKGTLVCQNCPDKSFKGYYGLRKHMKTAHDVIMEYPCPECGLMVKNFREMSIHKQKFHRVKKYKNGEKNSRGVAGHECTICSEIFPTFAEKVKHKQKVHSKSIRFKNPVFDEEANDEDKPEGDEKEKVVARRKKRKFRRLLEPQLPNRKLTAEEKAALEQEKLKWRRCEVCGTEEKSTYLLRRHMESTHEKEHDKQITCYFCCKRFTVAQTVNLHVMAAHSQCTKLPFDCDDEDCYLSFKTFDEHFKHLDTHLVSTSSGVFDQPAQPRKIYQCEVCGFGFLTEDLVEVHRTVHTEKVNGVYQCSKCIQNFETVMLLTRHYNMVHGKHILPHKCKMCEIRCFSQQALFIHVKRYHKSEEFVEINIACEEPNCGLTFATTNQLTLHLQRIHKKGPQYPCEVCGKEFYWPSLVKLHMRSHRDPEYECNICNAKFKRRLTMERHKSRDHKQEEDEEGHLKCSEPECDKLFVTTQLLRQHLIRVHTKGPGVMCQECGKLCHRQSDLRSHMRSHNAAQWECDICHKMFKRSITLKYHKNMIHNVERVLEEFICAECGASFNSSTGLRFHHDSKHTPESEMRYPCPNCPRRFHRGSLLRLHLKNCTGPCEKQAHVEPKQLKAKGLNVKMKPNVDDEKGSSGQGESSGNNRTNISVENQRDNAYDHGVEGTGHLFNEIFMGSNQVPKPSTSVECDQTSSIDPTQHFQYSDH